MKVALILPAEPEMAPYIQYYTDVLKKKLVSFDIIAWNRSGQNSRQYENLILYEKISPDNANYFRKCMDFVGFKNFVKSKIIENEYSFIIVHTMMMAVFMKQFLLKKYRGRYVLDIRDEGSAYSLIKYSLSKLVKYSAFNTISSIGFKKWLPSSEYVVCHNVGHRWDHKLNLIDDPFGINETLNVLTIGQIRHFEINKFLIDSLANKEKVEMTFAGSGEDSLRLEDYCIHSNINNVIFSGRYMKNEEDGIVRKCDFVNILLPYNKLVVQVIANRLYLAILNFKPVIVNAESIQAMYVKKYNLGLIYNQGDNLYEKLIHFRLEFDVNLFLNGRKKFLTEIKDDIRFFESILMSKLDNL